MIKRNDMMSVKDVQEMLGIPLLGAIPEDEQVGGVSHTCMERGGGSGSGLTGHFPAGRRSTVHCPTRIRPFTLFPVSPQTHSLPLPPVTPSPDQPPSSSLSLLLLRQVIVSTNRGEPLVLQKTLSLSGIAYENAARRLVGGWWIS